MNRWRLVVACGVALLAVAWLARVVQWSLPLEDWPDAVFTLAAAPLLAAAMHLSGGRRSFLVAGMVILIVPPLPFAAYVTLNAWMAFAMWAVILVFLGWPLAALAAGTWTGRAVARTLPIANSRWRVPCAVACLLVFGGVHVMLLYPEWTVRRVGAWRELRTWAASADSMHPVRVMLSGNRAVQAWSGSFGDAPALFVRYGDGRVATFEASSLRLLNVFD